MENLYIKWIIFPDDLSEAYFIRSKVFVEEQKCPPEWEFDNIDKTAEHVVLLGTNENPIATGRILETEDGQAKIGRVAVLKEHRGKGYGAIVIKECIKKLEQQNYPDILIHAQTYAIPFYEKLGFSAFGEEFIEDNIPHTKMLYKRKSNNL